MYSSHDLLSLYVGMKFLIVNVTFAVLMGPSGLSEFKITSYIFTIFPTAEEALTFATPHLIRYKD